MNAIKYVKEALDNDNDVGFVNFFNFLFFSSKKKIISLRVVIQVLAGEADVGQIHTQPPKDRVEALVYIYANTNSIIIIV